MIVTALWVLWVVFCCGYQLVDLLQPRRERTGPMAVGVLLGAVTFMMWLTDGRLGAFVVGGFALAYGGLVVVMRARHPTADRASARQRARLGFAVELGGRFSGQDFVLWRAGLFGAVVLTAGMAWFVRASK
jgi:hypothetical protein